MAQNFWHGVSKMMVDRLIAMNSPLTPGAWQRGYNDAFEGRPDASDAQPLTECAEYMDGYFEGSCDREIARYEEE